MIRSRSRSAEGTQKPAKNRNRCHAEIPKVTSRQPPRSSSAADAARAQGRPERGRDGQYASRISLRQQVDGRAAVESYNPSGASARLCEDPPRSQVADRNLSTTGPARCGTPLPWIRTCDRPAMNFPCKSSIFSVARAGPGQATGEARCAIASTREEEGARDDPAGTARAASTRSSTHPRPPESHAGSSAANATTISPPNVPWRIEITVSPTFIPKEIDPTKSESRRLRAVIVKAGFQPLFG